MTVEAFSSLPLQAGGAVAAKAGRAVLWAVSVYMRQPLRNTAVAALVGLSAMAGSNALYKQAHHHPAPLFGSFSEKAVAETAVEAVMPAAKPRKLVLNKTSSETTGSVEPTAIDRVIGNADVIEIQRKLQAFKLFDGTVDGVYGPRTARSIKAFEQMLGRKPKGLLTPAIIELIKSTPITAEPAAAEPAALAIAPEPVATEPVALAITPEPVAEPAAAEPVAEPVAAAQPLQALSIDAAIKPFSAPKPLVPAAADAITTAIEPVAETELQPVTETATIDPVAPLALTTPTAPVAKRAVQTIAVKAATVDSQTMPAALTPAIAPVDATVPTDAADDTATVAAVQRGLSSLGFLHGTIDGVAGEATAKAIRNFEVYYNYDVTGRITPGLVNLLVQNGAAI